MRNCTRKEMTLKIINIANFWQKRGWQARLLLPLAYLFAGLTALRRKYYQWGILKTIKLPIPVIVVGNITVGGSGKTPLVIYLIQLLQQQGYRPGLIMRGYGGKKTRQAIAVTKTSQAQLVGDEAVMLAQLLTCPIYVCRNRVSAAKALLRDFACNILISDDGLQHYALKRDIEIAVVDGERRYGNGWLLPAGPLRESQRRLNSVDFIVCNGQAAKGEFAMQLHPGLLQNLLQPNITQTIVNFKKTSIHAIAAIGNPRRFFKMLKTDCGLTAVVEHAYPDHYAFTGTEAVFKQASTIIMTHKDAVKCQAFAKANYWYLPVTADLDSHFTQQFLQLVSAYASNNATAE